MTTQRSGARAPLGRFALAAAVAAIAFGTFAVSRPAAAEMIGNCLPALQQINVGVHFEVPPGVPTTAMVGRVYPALYSCTTAGRRGFTAG